MFPVPNYYKMVKDTLYYLDEEETLYAFDRGTGERRKLVKNVKHIYICRTDIN